VNTLHKGDDDDDDDNVQTLSSLTDFPLRTRYSSSAVSVKTLRSLIYKSATPCPVTSCYWLVDGCTTPTDIFCVILAPILRNVVFL
jgi:hypothetical protein